MSIAFVDVETTGLSDEDRVVSLAAISGAESALRAGRLDQLSFTHLVFNPGRPSDPRARKVHGYGDWELSQQDPFSDHAHAIVGSLSTSRVVAHNATFDQKFIRRELSGTGEAKAIPAFTCTMKGWRAKHDGSAAMVNILPQLGLARAGELHGAFEDAWLAMQIWMHLEGLPIGGSPPSTHLRPQNYRIPPKPPANHKVETPKRRFSKWSDDPNRVARSRSIVEAATPTATMLLHVARANDVFAVGELDVLTELVESTAQRLSIKLDDDIRFDAVAWLYRNYPDDDEDLRHAARELWRDRAARDDLASWIRLMTYADGSSDALESKAIEEILRIMTEARPAPTT